MPAIYAVDKNSQCTKAAVPVYVMSVTKAKLTKAANGRCNRQMSPFCSVPMQRTWRSKSSRVFHFRVDLTSDDAGVLCL